DWRGSSAALGALGSSYRDRPPGADAYFILYCVVACLPSGGRGAGELCEPLILVAGNLAGAELERERTRIGARRVASSHHFDLRRNIHAAPTVATMTTSSHTSHGVDAASSPAAG